MGNIDRRRALTLAAALALLSAFSMRSRSAELAPSMILVESARLLDPRTGRVTAPAAVLLEAGKIKEAGDRSSVRAHAPADIRVLDLGSATLLPGLIDGHTHLLLDVIVPPPAEVARTFNGEFEPGLLLAIAAMSPSERVLRGAQLAREQLASGFTTVRNLGHSGIEGDVALRDAVNAGRVPGPRILAAGRKLMSVGYLQNLNPALADAIMQQEFLQIEGPDQARLAVRKNSFYQVDVIKATIEDDFTQAEVTALVDEAHRQHLKVASHVFTPSSIQMALEAGVDSIEHGNGVTDEQLRTMRTKGIFFDLTPTFADGLWSKIHQTSVLSPELARELAARDDKSRQRYAALVQRILKSGVKFAAGSDMCWFYPGKTRGQAAATMFLALRKAGMPPLDILRAVTVNAAEMLGWQDRVGSIEAGKFADLIAVAGDPLADIGELERVGFVMKGGEVIKNEFGPIAIDRTAAGHSEPRSISLAGR